MIKPAKTIGQVFEQIESIEFDVRLNVISGLRHFKDMAIEQPEFGDLLAALDSPDYDGEIQRRIEELLAISSDPGYVHPHDVALALYLLAIDQRNAPRVLELSVALALVRNAGWSRRIGDRIACERGLSYEVRWESSTGTVGELKLRADGRDLWSAHADWTMLLKHLTLHWGYLAYRDGFPLDIDARSPAEFTVKAKDYVERQPAPWRARTQEILQDFESIHELTNSLGDIHPAPPPLWFLRQGNDMWVASDPTTCVLLPRVQVLSTLRLLGDEIAQRVKETPGQQLATQWEQALDIDNVTLTSIVTGLDIETLRTLQVPPETAAESEELEWMAAARMLATADCRNLIPAMLQTLREVDARSLALLENDSRIAVSRVAQHSHEPPYQQGYVIANWLRRLLETPDGHVDPRAVLERWGVQLIERSFQSSTIEAIAVWGRHHGPAIILNTNSDANPSRQRATLAHEIAHLLLDRNRALPLAEVLGGNVPKLVEQRARAFAAEFLLPRSVAGEAFASTSRPEVTLEELATRYGVSHEVVAWQARNHGGLSLEAESLLRWRVSQPTHF